MTAPCLAMRWHDKREDPLDKEETVDSRYDSQGLPQVVLDLCVMPVLVVGVVVESEDLERRDNGKRHHRENMQPNSEASRRISRQQFAHNAGQSWQSSAVNKLS